MGETLVVKGLRRSGLNMAFKVKQTLSVIFESVLNKIL